MHCARWLNARASNYDRHAAKTAPLAVDAPYSAPTRSLQISIAKPWPTPKSVPARAPHSMHATSRKRCASVSISVPHRMDGTRSCATWNACARTTRLVAAPMTARVEATPFLNWMSFEQQVWCAMGAKAQSTASATG